MRFEVFPIDLARALREGDHGKTPNLETERSEVMGGKGSGENAALMMKVTRDSGRTGFQRMWERAARLQSRGRALSARRAWISALARSVKAGDARWIKVALAGLEGSARYPTLGPAISPALIPRPRETDRMVLQTRNGAYSLGRRCAEGFVRSRALRVLVDLDRKQVHVGEAVIGMEGRDVPLRILAAMAIRHGTPITYEDLCEEVWGRRFLGSKSDRANIYFHIHRLRRILEGACTGLGEVVIGTYMGYKLRQDLLAGVVHREEPPSFEHRKFDSVVEFVRQKGYIDNRSYCEIASISRSTALRELKDLTEQGLLEREGSGRGARYRLAGKARPAVSVTSITY